MAVLGVFIYASSDELEKGEDWENWIDDGRHKFFRNSFFRNLCSYIFMACLLFHVCTLPVMAAERSPVKSWFALKGKAVLGERAWRAKYEALRIQLLF